MMRNGLVAVALLLAGCVTDVEPAASISVAPVVAAERAFAGRAGEVGWVQAFREYTAPDGILPAPGGYVSAPERMAQTPDEGDRSLTWWPAFAGIARSGDIGFTAGPASFDEARTPRIYYFTIWRRQSDGSWKWIYDGGPGPVSDPASIEFGGEPLALPAASRGIGAEAARSQVHALEDAGNLAALLAPDAHVYRPGRPRAVGGAAAAENFAFPALSTSNRRHRTEVSAAGDLVFTLGEAHWVLDGQEGGGFTARVWQLRPEGWRIVYDQLIVRRPA